MAYSTVSDVLRATGLTLTRIVSLHNGDMTDAEVTTMITDFIAEADKQIQDVLHTPITIHEEIHVIDEDVSLIKVYLGSYDDSTPAEFLETWIGREVINVQGCVQQVFCVCINGMRVKTTDDDYPWTWTHSATADYITFTNDLSDGDEIIINYSYDPYAVTTPENVNKASKCMAGQALVEHLIGLRQSVVAFEAEGESGERIPDREALFNTRNMLQKMAEEALASIGYGFEFSPVRG